MNQSDKSYWSPIGEAAKREENIRIMRSMQIRGYAPLDLKKPTHFGKKPKRKLPR